MTIEIDDDLWQDVGKRFDKIRECARKGQELPENMCSDATDILYYEWLKKLFSKYKKGEISKEDRNNEGVLLRNSYIPTKSTQFANFKSYVYFHKLRMRANILYDNLTRRMKEFSLKKVFCMLFELIGCLYDDKTRVQKLKETAGYYIVTECKELSDDEIQEQNKYYNYTYQADEDEERTDDKNV